MPAPPPITIGLPVRNGARYLGQTLADLLGQTFGDFALAVYDNASEDETEAIVREAAARDARVRYVRHARDLGALPNANVAFAQARSPFYALAAYDDRHAPTFLARLYEALAERPEAGLAYGASTLIGEDDRPFRFHPEQGGYTGPDGRFYRYGRSLERDLGPRPVARFRAAIRASDVNAPIHGLFRREALAAAGPFRVQGSDRLVVAAVALRSPLAFVDAPLFGYRMHGLSTHHLTRAAWLARETGSSQGGGGSLAGTLRRYVHAAWAAPLPRRARAAAVRAALGLVADGRVVHRLLVPGPDNYWGWRPRRAPGVQKTEGGEYVPGDWTWLSGKNG